MGEYAKRKSDGQEVKIGTCESMYYLRYEDRDAVGALPGNIKPSTTKGLFWRLPFPDEDSIRIGEYPEYNRGYRLWKQEEGQQYAEDFKDEETVKYPGTIQLTHESGLLINVKCYHGVKLPDGSDDIKAHWNGKSWSLELRAIKNTEDGIKPIVHCRHCGNMWSYDWEDVMPYINGEMKKRLSVYTHEAVYG